MAEYQKSYRKQIEDITKQGIFIFDLDGTMMDSDDFIITNEDAFKKGTKMQKPTKADASKFCMQYLYEHHHEIKPFYGTFELFVRLSKVTNVAIVTSRYDIFRSKTVSWLETTTKQLYSDDTWRQMHFKLFFNEDKLKSLEYKKKMFKQISETYNILLVIDDHPEVGAYARSVGLETLVPGTGYKNLNGVDLTNTIALETERRKKTKC